MRMTPEQYDAAVQRIGKRPKAVPNRPAKGPADRVERAGGVAAEVQATPVASKYRNRPTNGFASVKEAKRAGELELLQKAGKIRNLRYQVAFELIPARPKMERACSYKADFVYDESPNWTRIVEDCKGMRTPAYVIKRKLMLYRYNIRVRET